MSIDINKINKIDTDLVTPTVNENLIENERDKWGAILNEQTFKTLNNNIKILKETILEIVNVNLSIETPHDDSNVSLQETERDNWGRILNNKTFKV